MRKKRELIKLENTFKEFRFRKTPDGYEAKRKTGVDKTRIMNDPEFAKTRENFKEFGHTAKSAKLVRDSAKQLLIQAKDTKLTHRMLKIVNEIKNLDTTSARGHRTVSVGIQLKEGKQLLKGFDFNANAPLQKVLNTSYSVDTNTGIITIADFCPQEQLVSPIGATHVHFRTAIVELDFETGEFQVNHSPVEVLPINLNRTDINLIADQIPIEMGTRFYLLHIEFSQTINGLQYPLKGEISNVLNIVEVI